ncbi:MAG TPA: hypothetical protein VMV86_01230 [Methanosarcinales archaeon]|nr:hypothetical protein [Methanosarcinales archaeon]
MDNRTSLTKAVNYYKHPFLKLSTEDLRERYSELEFVDKVAIHFSSIMQLLPKQARAVLAEILNSYHTGITCTEIAKRKFITPQTVSSTLIRLKRFGVIKKAKGKDKRLSYYKVTDEDWLKAWTIRSDHRFLKWKEDHDIGSMDTPISDYIKEISCQK